MESHLCAHPLIPGYPAPTPVGIREWAVKQMYEFCHEHKLPEAWAYLWGNWYRPGRWEIWAVMQPVYSSIENNYNTREPVRILPLIKQRTTYYSCTAGVASRTSFMISINHAWTSWYGFLLPNSPRRTIESSIGQRTSLAATEN